MKWLMGFILFVALNIVGILYFSDYNRDVDGRINGFTEEELKNNPWDIKRRKEWKNVYVDDEKLNYNIGTEENTFEFDRIYYDKTKQKPIIEDGYIRLEDIGRKNEP